MLIVSTGLSKRSGRGTSTPAVGKCNLYGKVEMKESKKNVIDSLNKAMVYYTIATSGANFARSKYEEYKAKQQYTITVADDDNVWEDLHEWILARADLSTRALKSVSRWHDGKLRPQLLLDQFQPQWVEIKGHKILVSITKDGNGGTPKDQFAAYSFVKPESRMTFVSTSPAGQKAVLELIAEICSTQSRSDSNLYYMASYGGWEQSSASLARPLESIFLSQSKKEDVVNDLDRFLNAEENYLVNGIPWHRGYLFYGPPGTGKTSLAKALATHFKKNVFYISLAEVQKDSKLISLMSSISPGSILLLEDVDVFKAVHDREAEQGELTLSGFLNALDGVATPNGLITIMTTNHKDRIDPAILRPGRVDLQVELGYADGVQVAEMFRFLYDEELDVVLSDTFQVTPAEVTEVFKRNMFEPDVARKEIYQMQLDT